MFPEDLSSCIFYNVSKGSLKDVGEGATKKSFLQNLELRF